MSKFMEIQLHSFNFSKKEKRPFFIGYVLNASEWRLWLILKIYNVNELVSKQWENYFVGWNETC